MILLLTELLAGQINEIRCLINVLPIVSVLCKRITPWAEGFHPLFYFLGNPLKREGKALVKKPFLCTEQAV